MATATLIIFTCCAIAGGTAAPLAIALIFGLRSIEQLEASFPGSLPEVLTAHHTRRTGGAS